MSDTNVPVEYRESPVMALDRVNYTAAELAPVMDVAAAVARYRQFVDFMKQVLRDGVDYGIIPGTGNKPTLYLPGAQKIAMFYGLRPVYEVLAQTEDWDDGFFAYTVQCVLYHRSTGACIGAGIGECNSREEKYYLTAWHNADKPDDGTIALRKSQGLGRWRKDDGGRWEWQEREPRPLNQAFSLPNTLLKMGKKRAYVDAVITAASASEFVTQDLEEMAEFYAETTPAARPAAHKTPPPAGAPTQQASGGNGRLSPQDWLGKHARLVFAGKKHHDYLTPLQIAERLSALGVDPAGGEAAVVAALDGSAPAPDGPPDGNTPASAAPAPSVTPDMATNWLQSLQSAVSSDTSERAPSEKMVKFAAVLLNECFPQSANDEARNMARHEFLGIVGGEPSLNNWRFGQVKALLDALTTKDQDGKSALDPMAAGYVRQVVQAAIVAAGQQELFTTEEADGLPF